MATNNKAVKKKKKHKIVKSYEYQKAVLYAIQALTGQQTHEIITALVDEADKHLAASGIDLSKSPKDNSLSGYYNCGIERRANKYIYYPGTKLYMGLYVVYTSYGSSYNYNNKDKEFYLKYNFKLPSSSIKMDQKEFDEYIADGILCDASKLVEEPSNKSTMTKEERKIKEKLQKERRAAKAAQKKKARQKSKKLIR